MASARNRVNDYPAVRSFESRAEALLREAESRGEKVHGIKPWYYSARVIESGTKVAFIGANPGGGEQAQIDERRLGVLNHPYEDPDYNAWLDDRHWGGGELQASALETFGILFGKQGSRGLRGSACFNVVPLRTTGTNYLSSDTWEKGVTWAKDVLEHVAPKVIVCNGNGPSKSPWSVFSKRPFGITRVEEVPLYNNFRLKHGVIESGKLAGASVIGLPHLSRMKSLPRLRDAAHKLGYPMRVDSS